MWTWHIIARVVFLKLFVPKFCSPHFLSVIWYTDFEYLVYFFSQHLGTVWRSRVFERQFRPSLEAFVILCGVQPAGWSGHLIKVKCCLGDSGVMAAPSRAPLGDFLDSSKTAADIGDKLLVPSPAWIWRLPPKFQKVPSRNFQRKWRFGDVMFRHFG